MKLSFDRDGKGASWRPLRLHSSSLSHSSQRLQGKTLRSVKHSPGAKNEKVDAKARAITIIKPLVEKKTFKSIYASSEFTCCGLLCAPGSQRIQLCRPSAPCSGFVTVTKMLSLGFCVTLLEVFTPVDDGSSASTGATCRGVWEM